MLTIIQEAGWPFGMLLLCSCILLAVILERLMVLRLSRIVPKHLITEVVDAYKQGKLHTTVLEQLQTHSTLGRILAHALKVPLESRDALQRRFEEAGHIEILQLQRRLNVLSSIATLAPLIGLLGTVLGMIDIFGAYSPQGTQPEKLAQGISTALYNTGFGIFLAVPAYIAFKYFQAKIDAISLALETTALQCMDALFYTQLKP